MKSWGLVVVALLLATTLAGCTHNEEAASLHPAPGLLQGGKYVPPEDNKEAAGGSAPTAETGREPETTDETESEEDPEPAPPVVDPVEPAGFEPSATLLDFDSARGTSGAAAGHLPQLPLYLRIPAAEGQVAHHVDLRPDIPRGAAWSSFEGCMVVFAFYEPHSSSSWILSPFDVEVVEGASANVTIQHFVGAPHHTADGLAADLKGATKRHAAPRVATVDLDWWRHDGMVSGFLGNNSTLGAEFVLIPQDPCPTGLLAADAFGLLADHDTFLMADVSAKDRRYAFGFYDTSDGVVRSDGFGAKRTQGEDHIGVAFEWQMPHRLDRAMAMGRLNTTNDHPAPACFGHKVALVGADMGDGACDQMDALVAQASLPEGRGVRFDTNTTGEGRASFHGAWRFEVAEDPTELLLSGRIAATQFTASFVVVGFSPTELAGRFATLNESSITWVLAA